MATQLCVDNNVDDLVEVLVEDAGIEAGTDAHDAVNDFAFQVARLRTELDSTTVVETTDDDVVITIRVPRS